MSSVIISCLWAIFINDKCDFTPKKNRKKKPTVRQEKSRTKKSASRKGYQIYPKLHKITSLILRRFSYFKALFSCSICSSPSQVSFHAKKDKKNLRCSVDSHHVCVHRVVACAARGFSSTAVSGIPDEPRIWVIFNPAKNLKTCCGNQANGKLQFSVQFVYHFVSLQAGICSKKSSGGDRRANVLVKMGLSLGE